LVPRYGRKVLELLPPLEASKGTAVRQLIAEHRLERALYAGDDTTDLDGFAALDGLEFAVRVAVVSPEGPPGLRTNADVILQSQDDVLPLLRRL
jgi:trehalose 6-phosphate phosphatase